MWSKCAKTNIEEAKQYHYYFQKCNLYAVYCFLQHTFKKCKSVYGESAESGKWKKVNVQQALPRIRMDHELQM